MKSLLRRTGSLLLGIIELIRKIFCIFKSRRKFNSPSTQTDKASFTVTIPNEVRKLFVVISLCTFMKILLSHYIKESESWDSWNASKKKSEKTSGQTRSLYDFSPKPPTEKPPEPDYFHELALEPQIRRAPQVYFVFDSLSKFVTLYFHFI